jgi:UDP-4-amino-4,6-dideoxy-N-acetyl-beta-L-altrosamine transaminase
MIPYGRQDITNTDIERLVEVLRSDFLTQGPMVEKFEKKVASYCEVSYAKSANSATSALHIACLALKVGPGDIVWTSPISFVASSNCALYCGAKIDFVDISKDTYNICYDKLCDKLYKAKITNSLPKVIVVVHLTGQSCEMEKIYKLSQVYNFKIIEDGSHAIGGKYKGENIGSCKYSDICIFSFHPVKIITTAEGGMALTNDIKLANAMEQFRSHGITRDINFMNAENPEPWYYEQIELGYNYRMTDIQAALGLSQMDRLDEYVRIRNKLAQRYDELLSNFPIVRPFQHKDCYSSRHLYVIKLRLEMMDLSHRQVFEILRDKGIGVQLHYIPIPSQPFYKNLGFKDTDYPNALEYYREAISLPLFPTMTELQQNKVVNVLNEILFK